MSIEKIIEFAGTAPESDKNTTDLDLSRGFPSRLHPARQWFNYLFNTVTKKINEIIDGKLDIDANAVSASKLQTQRTVSFSGDATGSFNFDGSQDSSAILTLANSGVEASTYGGAFKIPVVTVNAKGLITGVSTQDIQNASGLQKGVVQVGANINVSNGIISVPFGTSSNPGVVASGVGLSITSGVINSLAMGFNQSYKNYTGIRVAETFYTNNTPRPIFIFLSGDFTSSKITIRQNGEDNVIDFIDGSGYSSAAFVIPPAAQYKLSSVGNEGIRSWWELI